MSFYNQKSWFESGRDKTSDPDFSQDLFTTQDLINTSNKFSQQDKIEESFLTPHNSSFQLIDKESQFFTQRYSASQFKDSAAFKINEPSQASSLFFINSQSSKLFSTQGSILDSQATSRTSLHLEIQDSTIQSQSHGQPDSSHEEASQSLVKDDSKFIFNDESQDMEVSDDDKSEIKTFMNSQCSQAQHLNNGKDKTLSEIVDEAVLPKSIVQLRESLEDQSDWIFLSILAGQLCKDSFPMNTYHNLKLSLLLSLASINDESQFPAIPIVAVGQETSHANIIMNFVGKFAERFVSSSFNSFEGSLVNIKDEYIEAGPLMMSKGGVLFIGDWSGLPAKTVSKLLREIETGQVTTEKVQQSVSFESAVWTYWSCSTKVKKDISSINQFMRYVRVLLCPHSHF